MDRTARNALVVENLPLVGYLVSEVWGRATHLSRDDLASAGAVALITAAEAFDPDLGVPFGAYARRRVKDHLLRFIALYDQLSSTGVNEAWLAEIESRDNLFPDVNWQYWS